VSPCPDTPFPDRLGALWSAPADARAGRPLLVAMHGWSYDETHLFEITRPLHDDVVVASLRAPYPEAGGYAWFPRAGNPIGHPQPALANTLARAVLSWLDAQPAFSSVGLIGSSQGGAMALQVLRQDPSRCAYAVRLGGFVVSGDLPGDALLTASRPPVFWGRGARDRVIPDDALARTESWIREHADGQVRVYAGLGHDVAGPEIDDLMDFVRRHTPRRTS